MQQKKSESSARKHDPRLVHAPALRSPARPTWRDVLSSGTRIDPRNARADTFITALANGAAAGW